MTLEKATDVAGAADPARRTWWDAIRPAVLRLHFYAGVFVAPFILVAACTGLLYTATPAVEHVVYAHELRVEPGGQPLPLEEQVAAARAAHPEGTITQVRPAPTSDGSTRVVLNVEGVVDDVPADHTRTVFVNPYTGQVLGDLTTFGEWLPVRSWVDALHRNLHLGEFGRWYSELAASWLWIIVLGGTALWIGGARRRRDGQRDGVRDGVRDGSGRGRRLAGVLVPAGGEPGRRRVKSWHATLGMWTLIGTLFLSATGLTWSEHAGGNISDLRAQLSMTTPAVTTTAATTTAATTGDTATTGGTAAAGVGPSGDAAVTGGTGIDGALTAARSADLRDPLQLIPPAEAGGRWEVDEVQRSWPLQQDAVAVDATTGQVTDVVRFADWPLAAKLAEAGVDMHMGILFGLPNLLALAALAAGIVVLVVWGYVLWWKRRPTTGRRGSGFGAGFGAGFRMGSLPRRGALRGIPWPVLVLLVAVTVGVGFLFPLLGLSLLAFFVVDIVLGARRPPRRAPSRV